MKALVFIEGVDDTKEQPIYRTITAPGHAAVLYAGVRVEEFVSAEYPLGCSNNGLSNEHEYYC